MPWKRSTPWAKKGCTPLSPLTVGDAYGHIRHIFWFFVTILLHFKDNDEALSNHHPAMSRSSFFRSSFLMGCCIIKVVEGTRLPSTHKKRWSILCAVGWIISPVKWQLQFWHCRIYSPRLSVSYKGPCHRGPLLLESTENQGVPHLCIVRQ